MLLNSLGGWESPDSLSDERGGAIGVGGQGLGGGSLLLGLALAESLGGPLLVSDGSGPPGVEGGVAPGIGLGLTLVKSLWGPVAEGSASWVKAGTSQSAEGSVAVVAEGIGGPLAPPAVAVVSQTVSSLWGPLGVVGGVGVSLGGPLAKSASVAGGLESGGDDSGPAWVALGQDWSVPGVGLSVALADGVGKGAVAVVCNAELGQTGAGLMDESAAEGIGLSLTLAKSLWGPVAVGSTSWVKADAFSGGFI